MKRRLARGLVRAHAFALTCAGCGAPAAVLQADARQPPSPFAVRVVAFEPGAGAGFGQDRLPDVVLGAPQGGATHQGSEDVLSLGHEGSIVLELGVAAQDGDGPDLIVFENPFQYPGGVFAEPGEVSVSADGATWATFPCAVGQPAPNGCAGFEPVLAGDVVEATDAGAAGGDAFDLAWLEEGPAEVRFVRVVDRGADRVAPTAGFDLDAIAVLNPR